MKSAVKTPGLRREGDPAPIVRLFGWGMLAVLAAFLLNNVLIVGWGLPSLQDYFSGDAGSQGFVPLAVYVVCLLLAVGFVLMTPRRALRWDAMQIHHFNCYVIRACFWTVFLVGIVDATIAVLRVENLLDEEYQEVNDYNTAGSALFFGLRYLLER